MYVALLQCVGEGGGEIVLILIFADPLHHLPEAGHGKRHANQQLFDVLEQEKYSRDQMEKQWRWSE